METEDSLNVTDQYLLTKLNDEMKSAVMPVTVFVGVEAALGLVGNILVIYVFAFHYKNCNFRYFVLCLALVDLTSSLTTMPGEIITQLHWYTYPYPLICKIKSFFNVFTVCAEALGLLTIAVDRYLKVCWPLGFQIKPRVAKILCLVIYLVATIIAIPVAIFWGTHNAQTEYMGRKITVSICEKDQKYMNTNKPLTYSISIEVIISITLVIMFVLYSFVARRLILSKKQQKTITISRPKIKLPPISHATDSKFDSGISRDVSNTDDEDGPESNSEIKSQAIDSNYLAPPETSTRVSSQSGSADDDSYEKEERGQINTIHRNNKFDTSYSTRKRSGSIGSKVRRKTLIMFILTVAFIITTVLYLTLLSFIASGVLNKLSDAQRAAYFFFFRLYFINHVINPIIYGLLDPQFRRVMVGCKTSFSSKFSSQASTEND